jgi:hypothetical protein
MRIGSNTLKNRESDISPGIIRCIVCSNFIDVSEERTASNFRIDVKATQESSKHTGGNLGALFDSEDGGSYVLPNNL